MTTMIKQFILAAFAALTMALSTCAQSPFVSYPYEYGLTWISPEGALFEGPLYSFEEAKVGHEAALTREAEVADAIQVNIEPFCNEALTHELSAILTAIRMAENGGPGREFGILHEDCPPTYRGQAGWSAATICKHLARFMNGWTKTAIEGEWVVTWGPKRKMPQVDGKDEDGNPAPFFDEFVASLWLWYCPPGADNDPNDLNENWFNNVQSFIAQHRRASEPGPCAWR